MALVFDRGHTLYEGEEQDVGFLYWRVVHAETRSPPVIQMIFDPLGDKPLTKRGPLRWQGTEDFYHLVSLRPLSTRIYPVGPPAAPGPPAVLSKWDPERPHSALSPRTLLLDGGLQ